MRAFADISGNGITGSADFIEYNIGTQNLVEVLINIKSEGGAMKPGEHAVHIHEKGDCSGVFKCAGGHFDPGPSGNSDPDYNHPFHAGDLPNIVIDENGNGFLHAVTTRITLSPSPMSILEAEEGTALMIHANKDPYHGGDTGSGISGGPRLACGVIKKR